MAGDLATFVAQTSAATAASGELAQVLAKVSAAQQAQAQMAAQSASAQAALAASGATLAAALRAVTQASERDAQASTLAKSADISLAQAHKVLADQAKMVAKAQDQVAKAQAKEGAQAAKALQGATDGLTSSMMISGGAMGKVTGFLAKLGPEGMAAAVALSVLTAGVTALVGAIVGGMSTAIGVVEKMTQRLSVFSALGGSAAAGKATLDMVRNLSDRLPFTVDQLSQWAQAMQRAGQSGKGLETAVKAMAAAAALNPEGGAEAVEQAIGKLSGDGKGAADFLKQIQQEAGRGEKSLRAMGINMADLGGKAAVAKMTAKQLQEAIERALVKRGAGPLDALNNTFPAILAKAKEGFASLFEGIKIEPFMASVRSLFGMFGRGSSTMAAVRPVITSVFGTLFSWATKAVDVVHAAFQQIVIAALKVRIGINPILVALGHLRAEIGKAMAATGLFQGKSSALAAVLGFVGQAIKGAFTFAVFAITGFVRALTFMVTGAATVIGKLRALFANLSLPSLGAAAGNMIKSFVSGIVANIGAVMSAMAGMGVAAKKALFGALGIASPSKVALEAAGNVTSTFADKVDDGKGETQRAFTGMVKVPGAEKGGGGKGGGAAAALVAVLDRVATALEMNPGGREMLIEAFAEAMQESP